jgi:hypothetical protein
MLTAQIRRLDSQAEQDSFRPRLLVEAKVRRLRFATFTGWQVECTSIHSLRGLARNPSNDPCGRGVFHRKHPPIFYPVSIAPNTLKKLPSRLPLNPYPCGDLGYLAVPELLSNCVDGEKCLAASKEQGYFPGRESITYKKLFLYKHISRLGKLEQRENPSETHLV